jgi:hypothetical protein
MVRPKRVLTLDIGGSSVKALVQGALEPRKAATGPGFTPKHLMQRIPRLVRGWKFDAVSIGFPCPTGESGPKMEPRNLAHGWVGLDLQQAFACPLRWANDAAMQALGNYEQGRMLFLGLGTGLGSALVAEGTVITLELSDLPFRDGLLGDGLGAAALKRTGKRKWQKRLLEVLPFLQKAFLADYVVLGGGNAKHLDAYPVGVRKSGNLSAFRGGVRMWEMAPGNGERFAWTFL